MNDVVVPSSWLADHLGEVAVVDVRDAWEFDGIGHVPGAVNVPFDAFRAGEHDAADGPPSESVAASPASESAADSPESGGGEAAMAHSGETGMLPGRAVFAELMGAVGIERDDRVVAYDDMHGVFAARLLVTAQLYGHDPAKLLLLDGDFSAWQRDHETTTEPTDASPTTYEALDPAEVDGPLVDAAAVAAAVEATAAGEAVIVDTREDWEYAEGHVPGAIRLDWRELVDDESRGLKPRTEMESILAERGITRDRRIVLYCNTARRISHTYTVLRHLGYEDVAFYEGSLTEWEADGRPLERGEGE